MSSVLFGVKRTESRASPQLRTSAELRCVREKYEKQ